MSKLEIAGPIALATLRQETLIPTTSPCSRWLLLRDKMELINGIGKELTSPKMGIIMKNAVRSGKVELIK